MALSKRLFSIYSMVEKGSVVADIGCDHALLPIALIKNHICPHVYACDLREGPLKRAKDAIKEENLQEFITPILCDGLDGITKDVDTVIIAGMGVDTMIGIVERHIEDLPHYTHMILQCNKHVDDLRRWISEHHFTIEKEDLVEEDHFYEILSVSCKKGKELSEEEILFGSLQNHPLFKTYWNHRLSKLKTILNQMPKNEESYAYYFDLQKRIQEKLTK